MAHAPHRLVMNGDEPAVDQGREGRWFLFWNPDDRRFYVSLNEDSTASRVFKEWRNAVQYARTH